MAQPIPLPQIHFPKLAQLRIDALCQGPRFQVLDRLDAYACCRQYERLSYNWDGQRMGYAGAADIQPGWYVPLRQRRPDARLNLGKLITGRLTAMALGEERWPEITVQGDEEAEDFAKALVDESELHSKLQEARNKGGGCGTAVVSFGFVDGKPRVKVHDAKNMHVVEWADRDEHRICRVLKCYRYTRTIWEEGRPKEKGFYFARYWDENTETVWAAIPEEMARERTWVQGVPSQTVRHDFGFCPVYWCQNLSDGEREDGLSDIESLEETFDEVNWLMSATGKGTIANVDPTLVIKDDPGKNPGVVRKGTGQAIWSKGGAEYLELRGESVKTAITLVDKLAQYCLDTAGVVKGDPEKMGVQAQSGAAMKMLYLPMVNQCDLLRTQYGKLLRQLVLGMLRASRKIFNTPPGPVMTTPDGQRIQERPTVLLPPRYETVETDDPETGEKKRQERGIPRKPGTGETLKLAWPGYFPPTASDVGQAVEAATKAKGQTVSAKTAVKYTAQYFGVKDVDAEQDAIDVERENNLLMMGGPDFGEDEGAGKGEGEED